MMATMLKTVLSLFIAISVLVAPIAHAAEAACKGDLCKVVESVKKVEKGDKNQADDNAEKAAHHCCSHVSAKLDTRMQEPTFFSSEKQSFVLEDDYVDSLVLGPPLKPPSYL